jgi:hypothetical protein
LPVQFARMEAALYKRILLKREAGTWEGEQEK